jgi:pimeloyl-ACP methyl ester carboxylesterase
MSGRMTLLAMVCAASLGCTRSGTLETIPSPNPMSICDFQYSADVTIHCRLDDRHTGPTLVFLHGFGTSSETWHDLRPLIDQYASLYLIDLKGFGRSSKPREGDYSTDEQANIVAAFVRHRNLQDYVIVGHSYGGGIALQTYRKLKQGLAPMPKGLVLIDPAVYPQKFPSYIATLRRPVVNKLVFLLTSSSFRARYALNRAFHKKVAITPERIERYARFLDLPGAHGAFIAAARQIDRTEPNELVAHLGEVDGRTLVIWGAHDPIIPVSNADRLRQQLPSAKLVLAPGSGHVPHEEEPERVASAILEFLKEL